MMGRFVEETLGVISPDRFSPPGEIRATHVFELLQSTSLEDKLSNLVAHFGSDDETIEFRELFDLLAAQVFINDLLKGHTSDLHTRIAHYGHEIGALRQQTDDRGAQDEQIEDLKQLVKHLKRKESKLRHFLSRNLEIPGDAEPIEIVRDLIEQASGQSNRHSSAAIEQKDEEIRRLQANVQKAQKATEEFRVAQQQEIDRQTSELQTQLNEIRARCDDAVRQKEEQANEVLSLRAAAKEKDKALKSEIEAVEKRHQSEMSEANDRLSASSAQIEAMTKQIKEFEAAVANVKKQRQRLGHQIDRLQTTNRELQDSLETQISHLRDQYESKIRDVVDENEKTIRERDSLLSQNQVLDAKNQQLVSEIATVNIAKKSLDLKLRAYDERVNLEKRNIQSQVAAQVAAAQVEQANLVTQLQTEIERAVHDLLGLLGDDVEASDLKTVTAAVEKEFESARRSQYLYLDLLEDVTEVQKLLGLNSSSKIAPDVRDLVDRKAAWERKVADMEKKTKQDR
jgi:chromosome segregation ATPase